MTSQRCTEHTQEAASPGSSFCDQQLRTSHRWVAWRAPGCWHDLSCLRCRRSSRRRVGGCMGEDGVSRAAWLCQGAACRASLSVHGTCRGRQRAESSVLPQQISWREVNVLEVMDTGQRQSNGGQSAASPGGLQVWLFLSRPPEGALCKLQKLCLPSSGKGQKGASQERFILVGQRMNLNTGWISIHWRKTLQERGISIKREVL